MNRNITFALSCKFKLFFVQVQNRFLIWSKVLLFEPKLKIILNVCAELVSSIRRINYFSLFSLLVLSSLRGSFTYLKQVKVWLFSCDIVLMNIIPRRWRSLSSACVYRLWVNIWVYWKFLSLTQMFISSLPALSSHTANIWYLGTPKNSWVHSKLLHLTGITKYS